MLILLYPKSEGQGSALLITCIIIIVISCVFLENNYVMTFELANLKQMLKYV